MPCVLQGAALIAKTHARPVTMKAYIICSCSQDNCEQFGQQLACTVTAAFQLWQPVVVVMPAYPTGTGHTSLWEH